MHHKPDFPQITSDFKPSHNMVRSTEERFAMERMATRGIGAKKIATTLGFAAIDNEAAVKGCFFQQRSWDFDLCRSKIQRKDTSLTRHLTPWHSPQTPTAPQRQTTRGKTLLFCDASRTKNFEPPEPQNGPGGPINPDFDLLAHFFLTTVPQMVENTAKMRELEFQKVRIFAKCIFPR